jgi:hypothetical protein
MRPVAFGEASPAGTRLTLFSDDKPDRFFTVIKFWMDETPALRSHSEMAFLPARSKNGLPRRSSASARPAAPKACRRREEGRTHLLIHLPTEANEHRWCLWRPDLAGFDLSVRSHN